MKKIISLLVSLMILVSVFGCSKPADTTEKDLLGRIQERGTLIIATEGDWAPWTYHNEAGELVGCDVELGKLIAAELGVVAQFEETLWDSILAGVDSGRFDLACNGVGYTDERAEKYSFSDPYIYTHKVLIVRSDNTEITKFEDLKGKTTANTISSTYAQVAQSYGATVKPVDSLAETIELLLSNRIDATINSQDSFNTYMEAHPDAEIKIVAFSEGERVVIPMRKDNDSATLVTAVNKALQKLRDNGKLAELSVKYFKTDNTQPN